MTCKDCLHYDVCVIVQYSSKEYDHYTEFGCEDFKDKADFVEVVRCKDCRHGHWNQETLFGRCVDFCDFTDLRIDKDHYCSYGERKINNG